MSRISGLGSYSSDYFDLLESLEITDEIVRSIHDAPDKKFTSLGEVSMLGGAVAAGIKKRHVGKVEQRVARELYLADRLLARFPA